MAILVITAFLVLAAGAFGSYAGVIDTNNYLIFIGIVGTAASIFGLMGLKRQPIRADDFRSVELEAISRAADASRSLEELDRKINEKKASIDDIEIRRAQIESAARIAALKIILEERLKASSRSLENLVSSSSRIIDLVEEIKSINKSLADLEIELESEPSDNVKIVMQMVDRVRRREDISVAFKSGSISDLIFYLIKEYARMLQRFIR